MEKGGGTIMTNEEIIDEILHDAAELKIREQVLDLSRKLKELNPRMTLLESIELAFKHLND
jgi:hypothetical protein